MKHYWKCYFHHPLSCPLETPQFLNCYVLFAFTLWSSGSPSQSWIHKSILCHHRLPCSDKQLLAQYGFNPRFWLHCHFYFLDFSFLRTIFGNLKCALGGEFIFLSNWRFRYQLYSSKISKIKDNKMQCRKNLEMTLFWINYFMYYIIQI